jgi:excinuclease ABC subunit B
MPTKAKGGKSRPAAGDRGSLAADVTSLSPAALGRRIADMEQKMLEHAKNLEFEEAAALRDEVTELKQVAFAG